MWVSSKGHALFADNLSRQRNATGLVVLVDKAFDGANLPARTRELGAKAVIRLGPAARTPVTTMSIITEVEIPLNGTLPESSSFVASLLAMTNLPFASRRLFSTPQPLSGSRNIHRA